MKKIWAILGSVLIFAGLKAQEPVRAKKETTPVKESDKPEKIAKGKVFPKLELEYGDNEETGKYVKVDKVNREEALKGNVYLKVEGPVYRSESISFVYLKVDAASTPKLKGIPIYLKAQSTDGTKGTDYYLQYEGVKGETTSLRDVYLKVEGQAREGKTGFVYLKVDASTVNTAAATDYYLKIPTIKGETKD